MNPTSGYHINLLGTISPKILGSSESFYRAELKASGYYSILNEAIIFMGGAKFGTVGGFANSDEAPLYERYFLGGGDSLRGFKYRSISPRDPNGVPMGGQTMMLLTGEISHPIWNFIRGAVFTDIGNVWGDSWEFGKVNIGIGYGLRIIVPYLNAPIKLDLAYPILNEQEGEKEKLRFHFNMGFTF
jgi:outer membrane protein insertion porin family